MSVASSTLVARNPRRRNATLSCAECRRLKLKCSRVFPCSNCQKKGCAAICPDGMSSFSSCGNHTNADILQDRLQPAKEIVSVASFLPFHAKNAFSLITGTVLANTEDLHEKIQELSTRIRGLEDSLAYSHSLNSDAPHPMLSESLLQIKRPLERENQPPPLPPSSSSFVEHDQDEDTSKAIGSLSISDKGQSTFFSTFASSWHLLTNEDDDTSESQPQISNDIALPMDLSTLSYGFPFSSSPLGRALDDSRGVILGRLPSADIARTRADNYYRQAAFMYEPLQEADFWELVYHPIYEETDSNETVSAHTIALLCSVLAMGAHLDLRGTANSAEAIQYYHLARASLALEPVLDKSSMEAIQAMVIMSHFLFSADIHEPRWMIMGLVTKMVYSMGLHRDPGKWKVDEKEAQRRRNLMWEVFSYDSLQSLTFGRPPSFPRNHMDTKYPFLPMTGPTGQIEMSYAAWKHRYMAECLSVVHDQIFGAKLPTYKTAKDLDKKLSEYYLPPSLQVPGFGGNRSSMESAKSEDRLLNLHRNLGFCMREITIFYIHRGWFAQAMEECPGDPMGSKYSQSVLAAYNSACKYVALVETWYRQEPLLMERLWFAFSHVFSCCIVLGNIASNPSSPLARSALAHLENGYNLLAQVSLTPKRAKVLPPIQRLRDRALAAQNQASVGKYVPQGENATRLSFVGPKSELSSGVSHDQPVLGAKRQKVASPSTDSSQSPDSRSSMSPPLLDSAVAGGGDQGGPMYSAYPATAGTSNGGDILTDYDSIRRNSLLSQYPATQQQSGLKLSCDFPAYGITPSLSSPPSVSSHRTPPTGHSHQNQASLQHGRPENGSTATSPLIGGYYQSTHAHFDPFSPSSQYAGMQGMQQAPGPDGQQPRPEQFTNYNHTNHHLNNLNGVSPMPSAASLSSSYFPQQDYTNAHTSLTNGTNGNDYTQEMAVDIGQSWQSFFSQYKY